MFDPRKADRSFIVGFIEYVGGLADASLGGDGSAQGGVKRGAPGDAFGPAAKRPAMGMDSMDPEKMELVNKVKAFQRADQQCKDAWHRYCDEQLSGVRDPSRHEAETLRTFL